MTTKVIFRKESNGDILAVFPALAGDASPLRTCLGYAHTGQHTVIVLDYIKNTKPMIKRSEYQSLFDELTSIGYDLEVGTRFTNNDLRARRTQCNFDKIDGTL